MNNNLNSKKILAIETVTHACSIALLTKNGLFTRYHKEPRAHTRLILPMIDSVLKESNETLNNITAIACGIGPGSFTGVRIANSVTQALSFALNKPIIPVSSLRILAQGILRKYKKNKVIAQIDARMNEIYWGLYEADDKGLMQLKGEERLSSKDKIMEDIKNQEMNQKDLQNSLQNSSKNNSIYTQNNSENNSEYSLENNSQKKAQVSDLYFSNLETDYPEAQDLAILALNEYDLGHFKRAEEFFPSYLRNDVFNKN